MPPLLLAAHLPPALLVTAVTTALAVSAGRGWPGSLWVCLALLAGQLSIGWCNDWLDAPVDRATGRPDKPAAVGAVRPSLVGRAAVVALVLTLPLSLLMGWRAGALHVAAVCSGWAYDVGLKSTVASWLPYAFSFASLPAIVTLGLPGSPWPPAWAVAGGALLGVGAHFVNTLPDRSRDAATGVRGLPQRLPYGLALLVGAGLLAAAVVVLAVAPPGSPGTTARGLLVLALLAVGGVVSTAGRGRTGWWLALLAGGLAAATLLAQGGALARV